VQGCTRKIVRERLNLLTRGRKASLLWREEEELRDQTECKHVIGWRSYLKWLFWSGQQLVHQPQVLVMKPAGPYSLTPEPTITPPQTFPAHISYPDEVHVHASYYGEKNGIPYWPTLPAVPSDIPPSLPYNWKPPPHNLYCPIILVYHCYIQDGHSRGDQSCGVFLAIAPRPPGYLLYQRWIYCNSLLLKSVEHNAMDIAVRMEQGREEGGLEGREGRRKEGRLEGREGRKEEGGKKEEEQRGRNWGVMDSRAVHSWGSTVPGQHCARLALRLC